MNSANINRAQRSNLGAVLSEPAVKLRRALLTCGILSSALYVAMNIAVPMFYDGYDAASQTVSELSAIGAPTRTLWVVLAAIYTLMLLGFGFGVCLSAKKSRALWIAGSAMVAQAVIGPFWPPMHQRQVLAAGGGTLSDTLHIAFTMVWGLLAIIALVCGTIALGKRFRIYTILTILLLITFGILTGLSSPNIEANLPTPWIGIWERLNIGAFMLWIAALAVKLRRVDGNHPVNPE